ncbi:MAG: serpin family protein [Anaerolineales bacterium]|nr:serpin family protein [Anaerolineales bacterium]
MAFPSACSPSSGQAAAAQSGLPRETAPQVPDADFAELVRGNSGFAFDLYREISPGEGNLFYSPYSISIALAMTYAGARNRTAEEMAQALHFTLPQERLHPAFNKLALELAGRAAAAGLDPDQAFQLNVANALWGQTGFPFRQDFLDLLARNYAAGMRLADFKQAPEAARRAINDWVSRETKDKVEEIIPAPPPEIITVLTRLVLANAVYFKAAWLYPFESHATRPGAFRLLDGTTVEAPMMHGQARLPSMHEDGFTAVELPYAGSQVSMLFLVPDEGRFREVESRLDAGWLDAAVASLKSGRVDLMLPKFRFDWTAEGLPQAFQSLGMAEAFTMNADFSGMDGELDLYICAILHKAFVAVDEAGTEAAASTVVVMFEKAAQMSSASITIDRPFFFLIRDNPTGTILFLGRVMNPAA